MSEMIEQVAEALIAANERLSWTEARDLARVVIEAMREPTDAMIVAGFFDADHSIESVGDLAPPPEDQPRLIWQAMIDEALK
jgi:hypothetical protein